MSLPKLHLETTIPSYLTARRSRDWRFLRRRWLRLPGDLQPGRTSATFQTMNDNDLLQEIHRVRGEMAGEWDYDVHKIGERMRQREREEPSKP